MLYINKKRYYRIWRTVAMLKGRAAKKNTDVDAVFDKNQEASLKKDQQDKK